jgi:hypothetical protein
VREARKVAQVQPEPVELIHGIVYSRSSAWIGGSCACSQPSIVKSLRREPQSLTDGPTPTNLQTHTNRNRIPDAGTNQSTGPDNSPRLRYSITPFLPPPLSDVREARGAEF